MNQISNNSIRLVPSEQLHLCALTVEALTYLQSAGMTKDQLKDVHHNPRRTETYHAALRYFSSPKELRAVNEAYSKRLQSIAERHKAEQLFFDQLIVESIKQWPK